MTHSGEAPGSAQTGKRSWIKWLAAFLVATGALVGIVLLALYAAGSIGRDSDSGTEDAPAATRSPTASGALSSDRTVAPDSNPLVTPTELDAAATMQPSPPPPVPSPPPPPPPAQARVAAHNPAFSIDSYLTGLPDEQWAKAALKVRLAARVDADIHGLDSESFWRGQARQSTTAVYSRRLCGGRYFHRPVVRWTNRSQHGRQQPRSEQVPSPVPSYFSV